MNIIEKARMVLATARLPMTPTFKEVIACDGYSYTYTGKDFQLSVMQFKYGEDQTGYHLVVNNAAGLKRFPKKLDGANELLFQSIIYSIASRHESIRNWKNIITGPTLSKKQKSLMSKKIQKSNVTPIEGTGSEPVAPEMVGGITHDKYLTMVIEDHIITAQRQALPGKAPDRHIRFSIFAENDQGKKKLLVDKDYAKKIYLEMMGKRFKFLSNERKPKTHE
jgi:hypothetical protein